MTLPPGRGRTSSGVGRAACRRVSTAPRKYVCRSFVVFSKIITFCISDVTRWRLMGLWARGHGARRREDLHGRRDRAGRPRRACPGLCGTRPPAGITGVDGSSCGLGRRRSCGGLDLAESAVGRAPRRLGCRRVRPIIGWITDENTAPGIGTSTPACRLSPYRLPCRADRWGDPRTAPARTAGSAPCGRVIRSWRRRVFAADEPGRRRVPSSCWWGNRGCDSTWSAAGGMSGDTPAGRSWNTDDSPAPGSRA